MCCAVRLCVVQRFRVLKCVVCCSCPDYVVCCFMSCVLLHVCHVLFHVLTVLCAGSCPDYVVCCFMS